MLSCPFSYAMAWKDECAICHEQIVNLLFVQPMAWRQLLEPVNLDSSLVSNVVRQLSRDFQLTYVYVVLPCVIMVQLVRAILQAAVSRLSVWHASLYYSDCNCVCSVVFCWMYIEGAEEEWKVRQRTEELRVVRHLRNGFKVGLKVTTYLRCRSSFDK